jgi:hypothetical protein
VIACNIKDLIATISLAVEQASYLSSGCNGEEDMCLKRIDAHLANAQYDAFRVEDIQSQREI